MGVKGRERQRGERIAPTHDASITRRESMKQKVKKGVRERGSMNTNVCVLLPVCVGVCVSMCVINDDTWREKHCLNNHK